MTGQAGVLIRDGCRIVTVIGSGGKTSLIWHLATDFSNPADLGKAVSSSGQVRRKVLVTPTTKMFVPEGNPGLRPRREVPQAEEKLYDRYCNGVPPCPVPGISLAGLFNEASGKLESLPPEQLEKIVADYDLVLIEGDGSRGLPLKAWGDDEPVVPPFTDLTIGMLPLCPLGEPISEKFVHRLSLFLALTGAKEGEVLKPEHVLRLITGAAADTNAPGKASPLPGLFAKACGEKILFLNQIENDESLRQAGELVKQLPPEFREGLCGIFAGSVRENRFVEL